MTSRQSSLPSTKQCLSLTDQQCRQIQEFQDPAGLRTNKDWEASHQPTLIRLYMTMLSFPHIETEMKSKYRLKWSYKTYANRFGDWFFPVDRPPREHAILRLYDALISLDKLRALSSPSPRLSSRNDQPEPSRLPKQLVVPVNFFGFASPVERPYNQAQDRMSVSTTGTWVSSDAQSAYSQPDDTFSNPRFSFASANTSLSTTSRSSQRLATFSPTNSASPIPPYTNYARLAVDSKPLQTPRHDPIKGLWNGHLRVIPCGKDHSQLRWNEKFSRCMGCGFSQWHALMVYARHMSIADFVAAMRKINHVLRLDFAGNCPIHFLMVAGVGIDYFTNLCQSSDEYGLNSFLQNPLHVLNPQDLGEQLIDVLKEFWARTEPRGLCLTQRDISCRTPLHNLLQHPLERQLYRQVFEIFPFSDHQLRSFDTSGRNAINLMYTVACKIKSESPRDSAKIQNGITEVKDYLSAVESNGNDVPRYGFHDIARGAVGTVYPGFYQCRICKQVNAHTSSSADLMKCACQHGRDRNAPDETGVTPAHALITLPRCSQPDQPETPSETALLFRILVPGTDPTLREALHTIHPNGKSLIYNIATRGFDQILEYALSLEDPSRRRAMVNTCVKRSNEMERSVLGAVSAKLAALLKDLEKTDATKHPDICKELCDKANRLTRCKHILLNDGAQIEPSLTTRWQICH